MCVRIYVRDEIGKREGGREKKSATERKEREVKGGEKWSAKNRKKKQGMITRNKRSLTKRKARKEE